MSSPSTRTTRTAAIGPLQGISEMCSAALAAVIARTSVGLSLSLERTVAMTWVSLRNPSGKSGRHGRSMRREVRISSSRCRPSRLKKPPGILPAANVFST